MIAREDLRAFSEVTESTRHSRKSGNLADAMDPRFRGDDEKAAAIRQRALNALIGGVVEAISSAFADSTNKSVMTESGGFSGKGKQDFLRSFRQRLDMLNSGLTERELDVCARVIIGMTTEAIALELDLRAPTVATYRKRAYARLGISSHYEMFCLLTQ